MNKEQIIKEMEVFIDFRSKRVAVPFTIELIHNQLSVLQDFLLSDWKFSIFDSDLIQEIIEYESILMTLKGHCDVSPSILNIMRRRHDVDLLIDFFDILICDAKSFILIELDLSKLTDIDYRINNLEEKINQFGDS